jgi:hypothetical protein
MSRCSVPNGARLHLRSGFGLGALETERTLLDRTLNASSSAYDPVHCGYSWNKLVTTDVPGVLDLPRGNHTVFASVSRGDGYGVEIDVGRLDPAE